ncbi:hypothetical protein GCM10027026_08410 [Myroides odoratimimus subsp. xuanwuensis]
MLALAVVLGVFLGGAGCAVFDDEVPESDDHTAQVVEGIEAALGRRDRAVRRENVQAFLAGVLEGDPALERRQRRYFANLGQLPLTAFRHTLVPDSLVEQQGGEVQVDVRLRMQLDGYDAVPVVETRRLRFVPDPQVDGSWLISSDGDRRWQRRQHVAGQPWDLGRVVVREQGGVLGVFDEDSVEHADSILASVDAARSEVARVVPSEWAGRVVVYALSTTEVLGRLRGLPGGDPDRLDAVAFPVPAGGAGRTAAYRFMLHPRMLTRSGAPRDRLIRHELTHVALGDQDDDVPTWLSEGVAEWVSVLPLAREDRTISREALEAARRGIDDLPGDDTFNGAQSGANYGISWWACQHLVDTFGEDVLWGLLDAYAAAEAPQQDGVLEDQLGLQETELARRAGERIVATFG